MNNGQRTPPRRAAPAEPPPLRRNRILRAPANANPFGAIRIPPPFIPFQHNPGGSPGRRRGRKTRKGRKNRSKKTRKN